MASGDTRRSSTDSPIPPESPIFAEVQGSHLRENAPEPVRAGRTIGERNMQTTTCNNPRNSNLLDQGPNGICATQVNKDSSVSDVDASSNASTASGTSSHSRLRAEGLLRWQQRGRSWPDGPALIEENVNDDILQRRREGTLAAVANTDQSFGHIPPVENNYPEQIDPQHLQENHDDGREPPAGDRGA